MSRRTRKNPVVNFVKKVAAHRKNPIISVAVQYIAPALGGYVATHVVGRMAQSVAAKRWPAHAHFVGIGAKLATAGLIYYASGKMDSLKKHREAILAGVGIALFESLVRLMLPGMAFAIDGPAPSRQLQDDDIDSRDVDDRVEQFAASHGDDDLNDEDLAGGIFDIN